MSPHNMIDIRLEELVDRDGLRYIGAVIPVTVLVRYLAELRERIGAARFGELAACKARRDGPDEYHVTAVPPPLLRDDVGRVWREIVDRGEPVTLEFHGLGCVRDDAAVSYFVLAESPAIQQLRSRTGLPAANLHVTLGFAPNDIYNLPKDRSTALADRIED